MSSRSREQAREDIAQLFHQADKNGDGTLSRIELKRLFKALGKTFSEVALDKLLRAADADHDGKINMDELLNYIFRCNSGSRPIAQGPSQFSPATRVSPRYAQATRADASSDASKQGEKFAEAAQDTEKEQQADGFKVASAACARDRSEQERMAKELVEKEASRASAASTAAKQVEKVAVAAQDTGEEQQAGGFEVAAEACTRDRSERERLAQEAVEREGVQAAQAEALQGGTTAAMHQAAEEPYCCQNPQEAEEIFTPPGSAGKDVASNLDKHHESASCTELPKSDPCHSVSMISTQTPESGKIDQTPIRPISGTTASTVTEPQSLQSIEKTVRTVELNHSPPSYQFATVTKKCQKVHTPILRAQVPRPATDTATLSRPLVEPGIVFSELRRAQKIHAEGKHFRACGVLKAALEAASQDLQKVNTDAKRQMLTALKSVRDQLIEFLEHLELQAAAA